MTTTGARLAYDDKLSELVRALQRDARAAAAATRKHRHASTSCLTESDLMRAAQARLACQTADEAAALRHLADQLSALRFAPAACPACGHRDQTHEEHHP